MHGAIYPAIQQRFFDLLGEQGLAANFEQAAILNPVPCGNDFNKRRDGVGIRQIAAKRGKKVGDILGRRADGASAPDAIEG